MRRSFVLALVSALALLVSVGVAAPSLAAPGNAAGRSGARLAVGESPPPLSLDRISGTEATTLGGLGGRVVILDFWATWCRPCRAIMPRLDAMYRQHRQAGLSVVGLSQEPEAMIRAHVSRSPVDYTIARDVGGTTRSYGVRGLPTLVVLDRAGKVREIFVGVDGAVLGQLDGLVQRLLAEPAP